MMKTRRKSKAAAAAKAEAAAAAAAATSATSVDPDTSTSTRENSPLRDAAGGSAQSFTLTIPEDIDYGVLSSLLPDISLTAPSSEAIVSLYRLVVAQVAETDAAQREVEEVRAELERKDVELDQALQDKESAVSEVESTLESVRGELNTVKQENSQLGAYLMQFAWRIQPF